MKLSTALIVSAGVLVGTTTAYSLLSRRSFGNAAVSGVGAGLLTTTMAPAALAADDYITLENGIQYKVIKEGEGAIPEAGQSVKAHYTGWLDGFDSDKKFDSSRDRGRPFVFKVGAGQVIRGWDDQFSQMKVGERRQIVLPPRMAYGDRGAGGIIPPGATLYFDVELLNIL
ncbi:hypothetical protein MPSEU_000637300 [Mayamaea pseudoterrestris]|nr:hypothetical protein MPSEU_000637300 [Mayamaea pseudoterrestris]